MELQSRPLFTLYLELHPTIDIGPCPAGVRRIFPVSGGHFEGERLKGRVSPLIGSDLLVTRQDGTFQQDVRVLLEVEDGAYILMTYRGVRHASVEVSERLGRGEAVDPSEYYLRTTPYFETASPAHAWINAIVCVGKGSRVPGGVKYDLFEIL
ncbi:MULTISPECIES: DUF3237 domain-containing protein [Rhizobium]|uniref:UPF0311 protein GGD45_001246 n=1 Tax=Rhizobium tropici TaxID=398 RepID=A0A6P1C7A1_RHITR|nr:MULTISPECIES: DUF3237 domain-containing protein [Rhizobium]AGB74306.1 hypothetical protein RTCIAT899_PC02515 [Rhizobium tropici CIAT 899]MBB4240788.1 hypothetical protein [Rhizobium tropici]MBB5591795.1 hypothetical protein [Rhizobium tropici]MBB6490849.1 hypothetical protein [Rhizobium tropici]NEV12321.1 DUF3237 domain-containing protein [Rhizobium tropici]